MAGLFIVFEGIDGTGKTTQINLLAAELEKQGHRVVTTFEPSDGVHGRRLRELFHHRDSLSLEDELELFIADRRDHVEQLIRPELARGSVVLCDRYYLSTAAYQGARGADVAEIIRLNRAFAPAPDLFIILEAPAQVGCQRISSMRGDKLNDFEKADYLERVASIFDSLSEDNIVRIDATGDIDTVHRRVLAAVDHLTMGKK